MSPPQSRSEAGGEVSFFLVSLCMLCELNMANWCHGFRPSATVVTTSVLGLYTSPCPGVSWCPGLYRVDVGVFMGIVFVHGRIPHHTRLDSEEGWVFE